MKQQISLGQFGFLKDPNISAEIDYSQTNKKRSNTDGPFESARSIEIQIMHSRQHLQTTDGHFNSPNLNELNFLKNIPSFQFPNLTQLKLNEVQIESIEPLQKMHMPHLLILNLNGNFISTFKSLRKLNCPKLQKLLLFPEKLSGFVLLGRPPIKYLHQSYVDNYESVKQLSELNSPDLKDFYAPLVSEKSRMPCRTLTKSMVKWEGSSIQNCIFSTFSRQEGQARETTYRKLQKKGYFFFTDVETNHSCFKKKFLKFQSIWEDM